MAITSGQVAVTSAAGGTAIVPAANTTTNVNQSNSDYLLANRDVYLSNGSGAIVYLGPAGVTVATGAPLATSTTLKLSLHLDEAIYGIVASTGTTVSFLAAGS